MAAEGSAGVAAAPKAADDEQDLFGLDNLEYQSTHVPSLIPVPEFAEEIDSKRWLHHVQQQRDAAVWRSVECKHQLTPSSFFGLDLSRGDPLHFARDLVPQQLRDAMARYAARLAALSPAARADALARADASAAVHAGLFSSAGGAIMAQLNAFVPLQLRGSGSEGDRGRVFVTLHGGGDAGWAEYLAWRSARKEHSFAHGFSLALGDASDGASVAATAPAEAVARAHAQLVRPLQPRVGESPVACLRAQKELEEGADLVVAHALSPAALRDASSEAYRRALLAQVATALQTLRARGHLALVVGQVSDAFTVGLLYIAHRHFRVTHVLRPDCQREAGAGERVFFFQDLVAPPFAPTLQVLARAERDLAAAPERHEEGVDYMRKKVLHERPFMDLIVKQNHRAALASLASLAAAARLAADERLFPAPSKLAFARRRRELWRLPPLS